MFTDMVGYTVLGQKNEPLSLALVEEQRKTIRPILARHNGREVKTIGDAFLVEFPNALDAVRCAYDIQRAAREFNFSMPDEKQIHLRVGVHLGDVIDSGGDISGDAVNVASRIEPLSEDGGVCLSRQVYDHVQNKFELPLTILGSKSLKNVAAPIEVYKVSMPWEIEKTISSTQPDKKRIAILPFANMSQDPSDEYFADGITEEMISTLSNISGLTVISRTSIMQYKGAKKTLADIGRELRAGSILEGSVRKADNQVRITVQLVDPVEDKHLWAQSYDRELQNLFAVQSDVSQKVAETLRVKLLAGEESQIQKKPTDITDAHLLYLKGRHFWNERTEAGNKKAVAYFEQAIKKDGKFALGYSGLADCYIIMADRGFSERSSSYEKAKDYTKRALELDESLAEAHTALAAVLNDYDRDWKGSESEFRRALEFKPSYSTAHQWYAQLLGAQRRFSDSWSEITKALELDPFSLVINLSVGYFLYHFWGEVDKAIEQYRKLQEMEPSWELAYVGLIRMYVLEGMYEEALQLVERLAGFSRHPLEVKLWRACVLNGMGKTVDAQDLMKEVERHYETENIPPTDIAGVRFLLGDLDLGFQWLEIAYAVHDRYLNWLAVRRDFDRVRTEPRYRAMLDKIGLGPLLPTSDPDALK
jgi:TolB-like protein/Tfp pilus assembly protein PilF